MRIVSTVISLVVSTQAAGAATDTVSVQINQPLSQISKSSGDSEMTATATGPDGMEIVISQGSMYLHLLPLQAGSDIGVGFAVTSNLEVGATMGYQSEKDKKADSSSAHLSTGLFATYALDLGSSAVELGAVVAQKNVKDSEPDSSGAKVENTFKETTTSASVGFIKPVQGALSWLATVSYAAVREDRKSPDPDTRSETIAASPLGIRLDF